MRVKSAHIKCHTCWLSTVASVLNYGCGVRPHVASVSVKRDRIVGSVEE